MARYPGLGVIIWAAGVITPLTSYSLAANNSRESAGIHFLLRDFAHTPSETLDTTIKQVTKTFKAIGVPVRFSTPSLQTDINSGCSERHESRLADIRVHIVPRSFLIKQDDALGVAQENGEIAYIFYDRIQEFVNEFEASSRFKTSLGLMLACIISHETGHLLMPKSGHRPLSLMKATWRSSDVYDVETNRLGFKQDQAARMLKTLSQLAR